jgi:hypothetical protein
MTNTEIKVMMMNKIPPQILFKQLKLVNTRLIVVVVFSLLYLDQLFMLFRVRTISS